MQNSDTAMYIYEQKLLFGHVWTLTCNEMTVSLSYITFRKHCNSSDMFAKFDLHFLSFVFRLKT